MRSNGQASKSGNQEWREHGRQAGIGYRRNHETHEMKEVIGLQFLFSHPSAFRDFRVLAYPAVAAHPFRRGSTSLASTSPSW
jgi:hypothetical protein